MDKIRDLFEDVISFLEFVFKIQKKSTQYPFCKKTLKEIWELIINHEQ